MHTPALFRRWRPTILGRAIVLVLGLLLANAAIWVAAGICFSQADGLLGIAMLAWVSSGWAHGSPRANSGLRSKFEIEVEVEIAVSCTADRTIRRCGCSTAPLASSMAFRQHCRAPPAALTPDPWTPTRARCRPHLGHRQRDPPDGQSGPAAYDLWSLLLAGPLDDRHRRERRHCREVSCRAPSVPPSVLDRYFPQPLSSKPFRLAPLPSAMFISLLQNLKSLSPPPSAPPPTPLTPASTSTTA